MEYLVVLRNLESGIVMDISFADKISFDAWYEDSIKETTVLIAEGIGPDEITKYTKSPEALQDAMQSLLGHPF